MGDCRRIRMRVLGIMLILSLGCLSTLDSEASELTKIPDGAETEVSEVVLPQITGRSYTKFKKKAGKKSGKRGAPISVTRHRQALMPYTGRNQKKKELQYKAKCEQKVKRPIKRRARAELSRKAQHRRQKELRVKQRKAKESKIKLANEKAKKRRKLRKLRAKEHKDKADSKEKLAKEK